jgi:hypothetical protein
LLTDIKEETLPGKKDVTFNTKKRGFFSPFPGSKNGKKKRSKERLKTPLFSIKTLFFKFN